MKKLLRVTAVLLLSAAGIFGGQSLAEESGYSSQTKIRISSGGREAVVVLHDNPVSRDFVSLLPLTVTFEDYARTEKITYLSRRLSTEGGLTADQLPGDFTYYAPWGNLAVFYKGFGSGTGLYTLGRIESGKEWLAGLKAGFTARLEITEN